MATLQPLSLISHASKQPSSFPTAYAFTFSLSTAHWKAGKNRVSPTRIRASSDESDCNAEECAPEKEVGKVSMEWVAEDRTKVVGTFPPRTRGWTGYIEKDTAGQTNIYSVEPVVYIAETAISSGSAGSSADGSENTAAIIAGLALISIASASSILLQVGKTPPPSVQTTTQYSGPALSYYIDKLKPPEIVEAISSSSEAPLVQIEESVVPAAPSVQVEESVLPSTPPSLD